jgi:hypothetical protein
VTHGFVQKKSLRSRKDRSNGNELFDMNSRENIWYEAKCAERQRDVAGVTDRTVATSEET